MMKPTIPGFLAMVVTLTAFVVCLPPAPPQPSQPAQSPDTAGTANDDVPPMFPVPPPFAFSHLDDADFGWYVVTR